MQPYSHGHYGYWCSHSVSRDTIVGGDVYDVFDIISVMLLVVLKMCLITLTSLEDDVNCTQRTRKKWGIRRIRIAMTRMKISVIILILITTTTMMTTSMSSTTTSKR